MQQHPYSHNGAVAGPSGGGQEGEFGRFIDKLFRVTHPPLPLAPSHSPIAALFKPLLLNNMLHWYQLRDKLEATFGTGASIDPALLQAGPNGLVRVAQAFQRLEQIAIEGEYIEAEMWTLRIENAIDAVYKDSAMSNIKANLGELSSDQMGSAAMSDEELAASILVTNPNSNLPSSSSQTALSASSRGRKRSLPDDHYDPSHVNGTSFENFSHLLDLPPLNLPAGTNGAVPEISDDVSAAPLLRSESPVTLEADGPPSKKKGRPSGTVKVARPRRTDPGPNRPRRAAPPAYTHRTFPSTIPILPHFNRFYRQFYLSSALPQDSGLAGLMDISRVSGGAPDGKEAESDVINSGLRDEPLQPTASTSQNINPDLHLTGMEDFDLSLFQTFDASNSVLGTQAHQPVASGSGTLPPHNQNGSTSAGSSTNDNDDIKIPTTTSPTWNTIPNLLDLYIPRFVKGVRDKKEGVCPICIEPLERGGEDEIKWLNLRNSSYVYHMSYYHGIAKATGLPFSPPKDSRLVEVEKKAKHGRAQMLEGQCHHCDKWIPLQSLKSLEAIVPEIFWWKHAKSCHGISRIEGEGNDHVQDDIYIAVVEKKKAVGLPHVNGGGANVGLS